MTTGTTYEICTPAEYLLRERAAEYKSEYRNGRIVAMTGASRRHNLIAGNLFSELRQQLRGRPCEAYMSDMRVKVSPTGLYTYPDVVVACGEIRFEDAHIDTLLNPTLIAEVLSPSTATYDRGEKFAQYRRLDSLQEYVLIAQDAVRVEHYRRQGDQWVPIAPDDVLTLATIGCRVSLADLYERVQLPDSPRPPLPESGAAPAS